MKKHSRIAAGVAAIVAVAAASAGALNLAGATAASRITASTPCVGSAAPVHYQHVILIVEENHSYSQVIGKQPYETALAKACGLASNYRALSYPSLPNYIGMTSGAIPSNIAAKDCQPSGSCTTASASIFGQVASWKVYAESMPAPCAKANTSNGLFVPRHTGAPYFTALAGCSAGDVPLGTTGSGALQAALGSGSLPAFSLVIPNTTDDAHSGCLSCADRWLATWIPKIVASPAYAAGSTAVFITYDSDARNSGNHVATIVIAPSVRAGTVSSTAFNHYSLLRTEEDILGASGHLGGAATAASMQQAFNL